MSYERSVIGELYCEPYILYIIYYIIYYEYRFDTDHKYRFDTDRERKHNMKKNLTINTNLLEAIYHLCTYNETKILLGLTCYDDAPTSTQIGKFTGLIPSNNYFSVRKHLLDRGYIFINDGVARIDTDKILSDYANLPS